MSDPNSNFENKGLRHTHTENFGRNGDEKQEERLEN